MRVDQLLSQALPFSRKEVKLLLRQKRVLINGNICKDASMHIDENDSVIIDDHIVEWPRDMYYMLNKPKGYCCSHHDDGAQSALKLLPDTTKKLHFAGRLDADTTGLVLISSNGQWCHRVTSPKQRNEKRKSKHYRVTLARPLNKEAKTMLEQGIMLQGETTPTLPATIKQFDEKQCEIVLCEGRYHQVKRMFAAVGNHVETLHRNRIGNIILDDKLAEGEYRALTQNEIKAFSNDA